MTHTAIIPKVQVTARQQRRQLFQIQITSNHSPFAQSRVVSLFFFHRAKNNDYRTTRSPAPPISDRAERSIRPIFLPSTTPWGKRHNPLALEKVPLPIPFAPCQCFRLHGDLHLASF